MANGEQIQFTFQATIVPQGDGSYLVKPGKPIPGRERVTVREAVKRFGTSKQTMIRLYEAGLIEGERPSPRKTMLFVDSIQRHLKATEDPEFWESRRKIFSQFKIPKIQKIPKA